MAGQVLFKNLEFNNNLRKGMKKWYFSSTIQRQINSRIQGIQEQVAIIVLRPGLLAPKTRKKWTKEELEGNNTQESPQTGKVGMDCSHISCRMVGVRALKVLN